MDHTAQPRSGLFLTMHRWRAVAAAAAPVLLLAAPALGHTGSSTGGFLGGFAHPLFGPDHVVAMVAVGLWGAFLGAPAIWLLPIVFPLVMAFGGVIGILGIPLPGVETAIALSAVVLGTMVALAAPPQPTMADIVAYSVGFVVATGLLHLTGIAVGLLARWRAGRIAVRTAGGAIALAGVAFLSGFG